MLNKYQSKLKYRQMHQCKSIYIGKTVNHNQVKIGLKSESIACKSIYIGKTVNHNQVKIGLKSESIGFQTKSGLSQFVYNVKNIARSL